MVRAVTAEASVDIYNRLIKLSPSDVHSIAEVQWQLRKLRKVKPADVSIAVALLLAVVMTGSVQEAASLADELWPLRVWMDCDVQETYANILTRIGDFDRALQLIKPAADEAYDRFGPHLASLALALEDIGTRSPPLITLQAGWRGAAALCGPGPVGR
jgi:hypothetical protein